MTDKPSPSVAERLREAVDASNVDLFRDVLAELDRLTALVNEAKKTLRSHLIFRRLNEPTYGECGNCYHQWTDGVETHKADCIFSRLEGKDVPASPRDVTPVPKDAILFGPNIVNPFDHKAGRVHIWFKEYGEAMAFAAWFSSQKTIGVDPRGEANHNPTEQKP